MERRCGWVIALTGCLWSALAAPGAAPITVFGSPRPCGRGFSVGRIARERRGVKRRGSYPVGRKQEAQYHWAFLLGMRRGFEQSGGCRNNGRAGLYLNQLATASRMPFWTSASVTIVDIDMSGAAAWPKILLPTSSIM